MRSFLRLFLIGLLGSLTLAACAGKPMSSPDNVVILEEKKPDIQQKQDIRETKNVSYQGIVYPAGISIYMEGTHRLLLPDDRFILLESESADLNGYVNENVTVFGSTRPTVEGNATIMRVEKVEKVEQIEEKKPEAETADEADEADTVNKADEADDADEEKPQKNEENASTEWSPEMQKKINDMAGESFAPEEWTQQFCPRNLSFCIPVHRNFWFRSFGAADSTLGHVEISNAPIENIGDGPIVINLMSGNLQQELEDKTVRQENGKVVGYRHWTSDRHLEIIGPSALSEAVRYITQNLIASSDAT